MHDIAFPVRKTDDARRADQELVAVLEQMISADEPITVRAMVRRMTLSANLRASPAMFGVWVGSLLLNRSAFVG